MSKKVEIIQILESHFGTKVTEKDGVIKTTVSEVKDGGLVKLSDIATRILGGKRNGVVLKRSGTSITILVNP